MRPLQIKVTEYEYAEKVLEDEIDQCKNAIENALNKVRPNCRLATFRDRLEDDDMNTFKAQDEEMKKCEADLHETKTDMERNSQVWCVLCYVMLRYVTM